MIIEPKDKQISDLQQRVSKLEGQVGYIILIQVIIVGAMISLRFM